MDATVLSTLIAALSGLAGALIGGWFAYKGSIEGALTQIKEERSKQEIEKKEKEELAKSILVSFITHELRHNYEIIFEKFDKYILDNDKPFQHSYNKLDFRFEEFNKLKYELLKFETEFVKDVIDLYLLIMTIDSKEDINKLTLEDYVDFKKLYIKFKPMFTGTEAP